MDTKKIADALTDKIEGDVKADIFTRIAFSTDASIYRITPACVVSPRDADDVAATIKYAAENNIPVIPRGAGSGLAGEALGAGIVLDFTAYMNRIISISDDHSLVVCQPGVVLDDLNNYLAPFGRKIGPDPSSGNRAAIGGVVANNATGAHSLQYGYIAKHIKSIKAITASGDIAEFNESMKSSLNEFTRRCYKLLSENKDVIENAMPATKRNRSGYNIADLCSEGKINLAALMAGSEGTLAVFTEITLETVELPKAKALLQLEFDSIENTAKAVPIIVETGAVACEMMDGKLIKMAIDALPQYSDLFPEKATAVLLIEHIGQNEAEVAEKIERTRRQVVSFITGDKCFTDSDQQKRLWKSRKDAVPLLFRDKSDKKPVPFIEDISVDNTRLAEYIIGLDRILKKHELSCAYYGHAGDGELHIRPYLDLRDAKDVEKMRTVADEVFALAWSLGGTISGEHADGLVRTPFIKKQYGPEFYEILREIKNIFDPDNILNPGKIINDDPTIMTKNLKLAKAAVPNRVKTNLNFARDEFRLEIEQCNGDGVCRSTQAGQRMCPVFRAIGSELTCSRAKANLLQGWITGLIEDADFESEQFKQILGYCINCKMCSTQCPSGVDISKLIIEARCEYVKRKGLSRTEFALTHNRLMSIAGSAFSPISNFVLSLPIAKWALEKIIGLDRRRKLPAFQRSSFIKKGRKYLASQPAIDKPIDRVVYFVDSYANYNDHELGFATLKTLLYNNIEVAVPDQRPAPLPAIVYGDIKTARKDLAYIVGRLAPYIEDGYKVVCSEPSAALCLREDLPLFIDSDKARIVSENTYELMSYLGELAEQDKLKTVACTVGDSFIYHCPCHLSAMGADNAGPKLLKKMCSVSIELPDGSCCGLAGTCGMQKKNYELSAMIGKDMADIINNSNADYALTECAACKMQIEQLTNKQTIHPIKILAKVYGFE